jgi:hypothetical protein
MRAKTSYAHALFRDIQARRSGRRSDC